MDAESRTLRRMLTHPGEFAWEVLVAFREHQGLLLAGAVAYYTLLSIVPLFTLLVLALSHVVEEAALVRATRDLLELLIPGQTATLIEQFQTFLEHRAVVSGLGFVVMLFFSTLAFSVLETCMGVIFYHRLQVRRRSLLVSAALPYLFIALLGVGLLLVTVIGIVVQVSNFDLADPGGILLYLLGVAGLVLMLTSIYLVVPVGRISFRHALVGGVCAAVMWEIARHVLVWYFRTLSMVNVVYGSFATAVLALLSLEVAALILLLGAQVIAVYERWIAGAPRARRTRAGQ